MTTRPAEVYSTCLELCNCASMTKRFSSMKRPHSQIVKGTPSESITSAYQPRGRWPSLCFGDHVWLSIDSRGNTSGVSTIQIDPIETAVGSLEPLETEVTLEAARTQCDPRIYGRHPHGRCPRHLTIRTTKPSRDSRYDGGQPAYQLDAGLAQTMDGMAMTDCETGIVTDDGMSDAF